MLQNASLTQIGYVEEESLEIIDLIHSFAFSADFASWITNQKFTQAIIKEATADGIYTRTYLYQVDQGSFFSGRIEISIDQLPKEAIQTLTQERAPIYSKDPSYSQMQKIALSRIVAEPSYTIISHLFYKQTNFGMAWGIYHLPRLIQIYQNKDDPMRYWKNSRKS